MTIEEKQQITALCLTDKWRMDKNILAYLDEIQVVDAVKGQRTPQQNRGLEKHGTEYISFPSDENKMMSTREDPDFAEYYEGNTEVIGLD